MRSSDDPSPRAGLAALERALKANHAGEQRPWRCSRPSGSRPSSSSSAAESPAAGANRRSSWQFSALIGPSRPTSGKSKRASLDRGSSNDRSGNLSERSGHLSPTGTGQNFRNDIVGAAINLSPMGSGVSSAALSLSDVSWSAGADGSGGCSGRGESSDAVDATEPTRSTKPRLSAVSIRERLSNRLSEVSCRPSRASQGPVSPDGMPSNAPRRFVHELGRCNRPPRLPDLPRPNIRLEHDATPNRLPIDPRSIPI